MRFFANAHYTFIERRRSAYMVSASVIGVLLVAALFSFFLSVSLWFLVDRQQGMFVGLWVPSILALGAFLLAGRGGAR